MGLTEPGLERQQFVGMFTTLSVWDTTIDLRKKQWIHYETPGRRVKQDAKVSASTLTGEDGGGDANQETVFGFLRCAMRTPGDERGGLTLAFSELHVRDDNYRLKYHQEWAVKLETVYGYSAAVHDRTLSLVVSEVKRPETHDTNYPSFWTQLISQQTSEMEHNGLVLLRLKLEHPDFLEYFRDYLGVTYQGNSQVWQCNHATLTDDVTLGIDNLHQANRARKEVSSLIADRRICGGCGCMFPTTCDFLIHFEEMGCQYLCECGLKVGFSESSDHQGVEHRRVCPTCLHKGDYVEISEHLGQEETCRSGLGNRAGQTGEREASIMSSGAENISNKPSSPLGVGDIQESRKRRNSLLQMGSPRPSSSPLTGSPAPSPADTAAHGDEARGGDTYSGTASHRHDTPQIHHDGTRGRDGIHGEATHGCDSPRNTNQSLRRRAHGGYRAPLLFDRYLPNSIDPRTRPLHEQFIRRGFGKRPREPSREHWGLESAQRPRLDGPAGNSTPSRTPEEDAEHTAKGLTSQRPQPAAH